MPHLQIEPVSGWRTVCLRRRVLRLRKQLSAMQLLVCHLHQPHHLSVLLRRIPCSQRRNLRLPQRILQKPQQLRMLCLLSYLRQLHQRTYQRVHQLLRFRHPQWRPMQLPGRLLPRYRLKRMQSLPEPLRHLRYSHCL